MSQNKEEIPFSRKEWNRQIQKAFSQLKKTVRNVDREKRTDTFDLHDDYIRRRAEVLLNSIDEIADRYLNAYDENVRHFLLSLWLTTNQSPVSYTQSDAYNYIVYAASIWVLSQIIEERKNWKDLYLALPSNEDVLLDLLEPDAWHPQFGDDLIESVAYVLAYRNKDISQEERDCYGNKKSLADRVTARGEQHVDAPSRNNYERLISLIPQSNIDRAVKRLQDCFAQWENRFFLCVGELQRRADATEEELDRQYRIWNEKQQDLTSRFEKIAAGLSGALNDQVKKQRKLKKGEVQLPVDKISPILLSGQEAMKQSFKNSPQGIFTAIHTSAGGHELDRLRDEVRRLTEELDELFERHEEEKQRITIFAADLVRYGRRTKRYYEEEYSPEFAELMTPLQVEDPYEACFALLYAFDRDYDFPWLYGAGAGVMSEIGEELPWGINEYDLEDYDLWYPEEDEEDEPGEQLVFEDYAATPEESCIKKPSNTVDWYCRKYHNKNSTSEAVRSLAQLVYETTGCIVPLDQSRYDHYLPELKAYGVKGKDTVAALAAMNFLSSSKHSRPATNLDPDVMEIMYGDDTDAPVPEITDKENSDELKAEIKRLKAALHASEKTAKDMKKELETHITESELEHRELSDLRELIFNRDSVEEEEIMEEDLFPYTVQKETIIFGGHDSWVKAIKPMLEGNVKYVGKDLVFDTGMIRKADVLWIQANAMSHKMYYRIIDAARMQKKPVRYFTYASAAKCAKQIVESDKRQ